MEKPEKESYWIVNVSKTDISLHDLNLTIRSMTSINLLDKRHYSLTLEQIETSLIKGSLYKKRNKVFKRKSPPVERPSINQLKVVDAPIPNRTKSTYEIKEEHYEELSLSDDAFAEAIDE